MWSEGEKEVTRRREVCEMRVDVRDDADKNIIEQTNSSRVSSEHKEGLERIKPRRVPKPEDTRWSEKGERFVGC